MTGLDYLSFWAGDEYCLLPTVSDAEVISLAAGISKLKGDDACTLAAAGDIDDAFNISAIDLFDRLAI